MVLCCLRGHPLRLRERRRLSRPPVLCHPSGAPGAPPPLPMCFLSSLGSSFYAGASSAVCSARLASANPSLLLRVLCHVPGVALLSRRLCVPIWVVRCLAGVSPWGSSLRFRPVVRVFPQCVADFSWLSSLWRSWGRWISRTFRFSWFYEDFRVRSLRRTNPPR